MTVTRLPQPSSPAPTEVYEPSTFGLPPLRPYLRSLWERRPLIWHLARTRLKSEHYGTAIGQLWIILDPLLLAGVYLLVRGVIRPLGSSAERNVLIAHLVSSIFLFSFTNRAVMQGARSIITNKQMILNVALPRAVFPLVAIIGAFLDLVPTILVYFVFHAALDQPFGSALVMLPLFIALQGVFTLGCILLFAPLSVFFRDTTGFLPYMTRVWLFTTPILYTVNEIPEHIRVYLQWNPLFPLFAAYEQIFGAHWPDVGYLLAATAWAVGTFVVGAVAFLVRERDFATRL